MSFERRWKQLAQAAARAPSAHTHTPPSGLGRRALLAAGQARSEPARLRLAVAGASLALLYALAFTQLDALLAARFELAVSLRDVPRPPALPRPPVTPPPRLPTAPRLPTPTLAELQAALLEEVP